MYRVVTQQFGIYHPGYGYLCATDTILNFVDLEVKKLIKQGKIKIYFREDQAGLALIQLKGLLPTARNASVVTIQELDVE